MVEDETWEDSMIKVLLKHAQDNKTDNGWDETLDAIRHAFPSFSSQFNAN